MPLNIHPKVTAAALTALLLAILDFVTKGAGLKLDPAALILLTGAISAVVGYLIPTGTWEPAAPAAPKPVVPPAA